MEHAWGVVVKSYVIRFISSRLQGMHTVISMSLVIFRECACKKSIVIVIEILSTFCRN